MKMFLITQLLCAVVALQGQSLNFVPVLQPESMSALCADDPPSSVVSLADISVGIPPDVPDSVVCGLSCTGRNGCTSFNYRHATSANCEFFTSSVENCSTSSNSFCQHYQISGAYPASCRPVVTGGWSDWQTSQNCTTVGQRTSKKIRYCHNPTPSNGGSACINSTGGLSLIEYGQISCGVCDPNCGSNCSANGYLTCDGLCNVGFGIDNSSHTCQACNASECLGSCNNYGPHTCDGPCTLGYVVDTASHVCEVFPYTVVGCYVDSWLRDLSGSFNDINGMTLAMCAHFCYRQGYYYAGAQYGYQCLCGNTYGMYGPSTGCTFQCVGNSSQICGGGLANTVMYYHWCSSDCRSSCNNSVNMGCDGNCTAGYGVSGPVSPSQTCLACNTPNCMGSCNKYGPGTCDGPCELGYAVHPTSHTCIPFRYNVTGCFADSSTRDLSGSMLCCFGGLTLSLCAQYCYGQGYQFAGAGNGNECHCGNTYGSLGPATNCNVQCTGNSSQICGGAWANSVISYNCDPNCADPGDCNIHGVGKCDTKCTTSKTLSAQFTCV